jgi:hypothetical protein
MSIQPGEAETIKDRCDGVRDSLMVMVNALELLSAHCRGCQVCAGATRMTQLCPDGLGMMDEVNRLTAHAASSG